MNNKLHFPIGDTFSTTKNDVRTSYIGVKEIKLMMRELM